jgi:hypothetical protein
MSWRRHTTGRLANTGQFRSDSIGRVTGRAVEHLRVHVERRVHLRMLSFAKTGAALLPVTIATSRQLIASMIAMVGRPERSDGTYVRPPVSGI